jgi:hypothetical protein
VDHTIEFTVDLQLTPARPSRRRSESVVLHRGTRLPARLRPHVVESDYGPVEVADLFFEDGRAVLDVPFACFRFPD